MAIKVRASKKWSHLRRNIYRVKLTPNRRRIVRNPRISPQNGDVLEHIVSGERRTVVARTIDSEIRYIDRNSTASVCSRDQWQEWAKQTSILGLGGAMSDD